MTKQPSQKDRDAARGNTRVRIEQWAQNPSCEANTISAVRNVRMATVAKSEGLPVTFGQSPFAIARGIQFESTLFEDGAQGLIAKLIEKDVLPGGASGFVDLRTRKNGGTKVNSLDDAIEQTRALIRGAVESPKGRSGSLPAVAAGATLRIPKGILLPEAILIIDVLAMRHDGERHELIVGEVKTYPDRGGHTSPHELSMARAQAGIYVHGLDLVVSELGLGHRITVSREGFLVLTRPGSNQPSIRAGEDFSYQAERARRGFALLERAAAALSAELWAVGDSDVPDVLIKAIAAAGTDYNEDCLSFCDLSPRCFENARRKANPVILGEEVRRFLGEVDLDRAKALLAGGKPRSDAERDLVRRIQKVERMAGE